MDETTEALLVGDAYLTAATELLQRIRSAHPTAGLYEAADLQWWWRDRRPTDDIGQLFWLDGDGRPEAAVVLTAWSDRAALDPFVLPGTSPYWVANVLSRGLAHAAGAGFESVGLEVADDDHVLLDALSGHGFTEDGEGVVETWLAAERRPPVSPLADGFVLRTRAAVADRPHHMISAERGHGDPEPRLRETSLYRSDLDLVVYDPGGKVAAYGLFWHDPTTATGLVEPMRTEEEHQRRGLARHVLTSGLDLLAAAGATRIKICYEPDNPPARDLYLSAGFEPDRRTVLFSGLTSTGATR